MSAWNTGKMHTTGSAIETDHAMIVAERLGD
jgi:hypothetical protein